MEDSFNVRVSRAFGSLASSSSSSSNTQFMSSLWSLTDDEIERRERRRDKESPESAAAAAEEEEEEEDEQFEKFRRQKKPIDFRMELEKDLEDLGDEAAEEEEEEGGGGASSSSSNKAGKPEDYNDEQWEIKSSIGRDCTLDYEEEEDEYDKVAVGREKAGDRLYMKDVNDYEVDGDSFDELPTTFKDFNRDPRANHIAAKLRLKEDAEAAKKRLEDDAETTKKIDSLRVSDADGDAPAGGDAHVSSLDANLKPILKRKDADSNPKSQKRVRFDSECKNDCSEGLEGTKDVSKDACSTEEEEGVVSDEACTLPQDYPSGIPDYMRNPSKYTRYTFDSGDVDDESNRESFMDFLKLIKKSNATEQQADECPVDLTKPLTFIPRRKSSDIIMGESCSESKQNQEDSDSGSMKRRGLPVEDTCDGVCAMEEDEPQTIIDKRNGSQRSGRQYRMKSSWESEE